MTQFKIMKFGGTSVGKPERMRQVSQLITADKENKIVVLSALSGTTNALVEIGNAIAAGQREKAAELIAKLDRPLSTVHPRPRKTTTLLRKSADPSSPNILTS